MASTVPAIGPAVGMLASVVAAEPADVVTSPVRAGNRPAGRVPEARSEADPVVATVAKPARAVPVARDAASLKRSSASKKGVEEAFPSKAQLKKASDAKAAAVKKVATKAVSKRATGQFDAEKVAKPKIKTLVVNAPAKPAAKKVVARKATTKPASRAPAQSAPAKKTASRKA